MSWIGRLRWLIPAAAAIALQAQSSPQSTWLMDSSTLTYRVTHPVHEIEGTSHAGKGKGICQAGFCEFLVAAPVKSFDSGDTNRDLHMLQTVRGAEFPVVTVRFRIPESATSQPSFQADLDIGFAGQTEHFTSVRFDQTISGQEHKITGVVPATVKDFKIAPPKFLTVPIRNEIPVMVETTWHPQ